MRLKLSNMISVRFVIYYRLSNKTLLYDNDKFWWNVAKCIQSCCHSTDNTYLMMSSEIQNVIVILLICIRLHANTLARVVTWVANEDVINSLAVSLSFPLCYLYQMGIRFAKECLGLCPNLIACCCIQTSANKFTHNMNLSWYNFL